MLSSARTAMSGARGGTTSGTRPAAASASVYASFTRTRDTPRMISVVDVTRTAGDLFTRGCVVAWRLVRPVSYTVPPVARHAIDFVTREHVSSRRGRPDWSLRVRQLSRIDGGPDESRDGARRAANDRCSHARDPHSGKSQPQRPPRGTGEDAAPARNRGARTDDRAAQEGLGDWDQRSRDGRDRDSVRGDPHPPSGDRAAEAFRTGGRARDGGARGGNDDGRIEGGRRRSFERSGIDALDRSGGGPGRRECRPPRGNRCIAADARPLGARGRCRASARGAEAAHERGRWGRRGRREVVGVVNRDLRAALALWLLPAATSAQENTLQCNGQLIDEILIQSAAPTVASLKNIPVAAEVVRTLHVTTRPDLIRRFLLLREGDTCNEL